MSTALTTPGASERKAIITLGEERIGVRLDSDGFLTRTIRTLKLMYGTHLYAATPSPKPADKVMPYQPGYMHIVHAMGGQLTCPPVVRDPVTGQARANPYVEFYPGTSIVRSVTATAVCAVRNPVTGAWHVSVQTVTQDAEHMLRQKLMNMERDDLVRYFSNQQDLDEERASGAVKGWYTMPLGAGVILAANLKMGGVREAIRDFQNAGQTLRQRACSKAERLAADHNPVTRRVWTYGELKRQMAQGSDGPYEAGPRYVEVTCVAWVDHRDQRAMEAFVASLAAHEEVDGVAELVSGEHNDDLSDGVDVDPEPEAPQLTDRGEPEVIQRSVERETVKVQPEPVKAAEPTKARSPMRARVEKLRPEIPDELWPDMLRKCRIADLDAADDTSLQLLRDEMNKFLGGAS